MLHAVVEGSGPRVVLVHGFTQTLRSWDGVAGRLSASYEVTRPDLPGHGGSAGERLDFEAATRALGDRGGQGAYVGYSLGGRLCLRLAVDRPDLVVALVLVGASPGLARPEERAERRRTDEEWAQMLERAGVDAFLSRWLDQPLFATLPRAAAAIEDRARNPAAGLAAVLRLLGTGVQEPLWERLPSLAVPTLLVAGADDQKFGVIARAMAGRIGDAATVVLVPNTGHAVHLERPDAFAEIVEEFLARHHATAE